MDSWNFKTMKNSVDKAVMSFDQVLGMVRILRSSLEARHQDPEITLTQMTLLTFFNGRGEVVGGPATSRP